MKENNTIRNSAVDKSSKCLRSLKVHPNFRLQILLQLKQRLRVFLQEVSQKDNSDKALSETLPSK